MRPPFVVIDVGARWGVAERWRGLGAEVHVYGFDPDADECARLNAMEQESSSSAVVRYVPVALGDRVGDRVLHVTSEPACSSIYPPDQHLIDALPSLEAMSPLRTTTVAMTTLDAWCAIESIDRIDVLKLDTQGSELGVLQGAEAMLAAVQLLEIEVEFNPLYIGQPLFGDVDAYLRARGFLLWRLDHLVHYSHDGASGGTVDRTLTRLFHDSAPTTVEVPGGRLFWGHAYYARAEWCPGSGGDGPDEARGAVAALAAAMGLPDLAEAIRTRSARSG